MVASINTIALLGTCLMVNQVFGGIEHTTNGGGEPCGPQGKRCLDSSRISCDTETNTCKCPYPFIHGSADMICYVKNSVRAEVDDDPTFRTTEDLSIKLPVPCRYLVSHIVTKLKRRTRAGFSDLGSCEFVTHTFHQKWKGKFYVGGYDVALKIKYKNTEKKKSVRFQGKAMNGTYHYIVNATDDMFLPHGPWKSDAAEYTDKKMRNLRIKLLISSKNNLAYYNIRMCGLTFYFRPYDLELGLGQQQKPFFSYAANPYYEPKLKSVDKVVTPPINEEGKLTLLPGLDMEQTLLVRALSSGAAQNSPEPNSKCSASAGKMNSCQPDTLPLALNRCTFILKLPRFINCYDQTESGERIMELFNSCIDVYCSRTVSCQSIINKIKASECHQIREPYLEVTEFVMGTKCPVEEK